MNNDIKLKITSIVAKWELNNAFEYSTFLDARKQKTDNLKTKFAELPKHDFILRLLYEVPEGLDVALNAQLNDGEKEFLKSAIGAMWFAKTFKQYNVSQKV